MRYTAQWTNWFPSEFNRLRIPFRQYHAIGGGELKPGEFLSPRTVNIKIFQLSRLLENLIKDKSKPNNILFGDIWFPGIEAIPYLSRMSQGQYANSAIYGFLHAGTYDMWDRTNQLGLTVWGEPFEDAIFNFIEKVFVATDFHKKLVCSKRDIDPDRVIVTGLPVDIVGLSKIKSPIDRKGIIFTGRPVVEKGYDKVKLCNMKICCTQLLNPHLSKQRYYKLLASSKIVFAPSRQETFGYGIVEGMACGCIPIVPNALAFTDYVPPECRYRTEKEMIKLLINPPDFTKRELLEWVKKYDYSIVIPRVLKEMKYKLNVGVDIDAEVRWVWKGNSREAIL
jgi:glycosyltransferase involved in cell wall biosynthesis